MISTGSASDGQVKAPRMSRLLIITKEKTRRTKRPVIGWKIARTRVHDIVNNRAPSPPIRSCVWRRYFGTTAESWLNLYKRTTSLASQGSTSERSSGKCALTRRRIDQHSPQRCEVQNPDGWPPPALWCRVSHHRLTSGQNSFSTCEVASVPSCTPQFCMKSGTFRLSG